MSENVHAEVKPSGKAALVQSLQVVIPLYDWSVGTKKDIFEIHEHELYRSSMKCTEAWKLALT